MFLADVDVARSTPTVLNTNLVLSLVLNTTNCSGAPSVRIARDLRSDQLYYLNANGYIFKVDLLPAGGSTSSTVYSAADHGLSSSALGMAIGPDGTIYVVGN